MSTLPARLTIAPYLQHWNPADGLLTVHVLLVPAEDPRQPLSNGWPGVTPAPAFIGSSIVLDARLSDDPGHLPTRADVGSFGQLFPLIMPATQQAIADTLATHFTLTLPAVVPERRAEQTLRKYLSESYRKAFAFVEPRTPLAITDDSYHCAIRCPPELPPPPSPTRDMSWGEALAVLMRQPALARAMGLVYTVTVDAGSTFEKGGWLFFTLDASGDFAVQAAADDGFARFFATRVPALQPGIARPVFTPVLFPVAADAAGAATLGNYDEVYLEVARFNDGFAKIVHASQARTSDPLEEGEEGLPPPRDIGIQLGWDDEDILISQNRMFGLNPDGSVPPEAPWGTAGYRVDVRPAGDQAWHSLCRVRAESLHIGPVELGDVEGELNVEVHPNRVADRFWLPMYFVRWHGSSLVVDTAEERLLMGLEDATPDLHEPIGEDAVPLRYGQEYQFRVRMADVTGGSPGVEDAPHNPGEAPVVTWHFRRHIPPGPVGIDPVPPGPGAVANRYRITRPGLGHPAAVMTGAPDARARLLALAAGTIGDITIPDPDVLYLEVRVLVRSPTFMPGTDADGYRDLYTTYRSFPTDADQALELELAWVDCAKLSDVAWEVPTAPAGTVSGQVPIPTARDVRIAVRGVGLNDFTYFGSARARRGPPSDLTDGPLRVSATSEADLFRPTPPPQATAAVFLQPDPPASAPTQAAVLQTITSPVLAKRLAAAVMLEEDAGTLLGPAGRRVVFGSSPGIKHYVPPDRSSLTLTALGELPRLWINVVRVELNRDWTWLGYAEPAFSIRRILRLVPIGVTSTLNLGSVQMMHAVNRQAVTGAVDVDRTELIFLDGFAPPLHGELPYEVEVTYEVTVRLATGSTQTFSVTNRLPVATPPAQVPKVVSAGHAFGEYQATGDYSATARRSRMLWLEFEEAPRDLRDTYFVRVLANAPDPMLLPATDPAPDPADYEKPALDPELVRVIRPGQADDFAGLAAMQRLLPATDSDRHFLVPLPPNLSPHAPELFGFFTYELRVGHDRGTPESPFWSTAQGRFGVPVVIEGVQHPAPTLSCSVRREPAGVIASADYAQAIHRGQRVLVVPPNTEIWFVLYAQVHQADKATMRNIRLDVRQAALERQVPPSFTHVPWTPAISRELVGFSGWVERDIEALLHAYGLPGNTSLSVLAVELLPEPNGRLADPLRGDLGHVRILRTSPLTRVDHSCC